MSYSDYLLSLRCDCNHCESECCAPEGPDCLWYSPYRYALSQGADEDTAWEFREWVRERGMATEARIMPPTKEAWKRFQAHR